MSKPSTGFFNSELASQYDEKNRRLKPISECLHFLMGMVLKDLPDGARVLSVGAGTGAEILSLARLFPNWTFVAVDPAAPMLEICRERLGKAGVLERCDLVEGYVQDVKENNFDAVVSLLAGHFVKREDRPGFYQSMVERLRHGGRFVNAEISYDLDSPEFPFMLKNWEEIQRLMGATPESIATLPRALKEMLTVLSPRETEDYIRRGGIHSPVRFFQAFMICGWYGVKTN